MTDIVIYKELEDILNAQHRPKEDMDDIFRAYKFAERLHNGQYRISEEPYIIHPFEVAKILADLRVDKDTIIAAFLHDILEDTDTQPEEIKEQFGEDVLNLVTGVTKLSKYHFKSKEERQAESFRRMFIAMANDVRVIFLKLADRLHNMRTLNYMAQNKQLRIAQETLDIFAPLANRLGIGRIKAELEDLSLRYINPEKYFEIAQLVAQKKTERDLTVQLLIDKISTVLKQHNIDAEITGRAKHYYSIYKKMKRLNIAFHDLYDITAVRVMVKDEGECYEVLGIIHSQFKPIPGRFKDYIAMPKSNGYKSLHTSVLGPRQKPLEVQIRTQEMHHVAEYGVAAHWRYKESGSQKADSETDIKFSWMRKMVEMDKDAKNANEFVENVKLDLFSNQVFAFTPMGDVIDLPQNATAVDFAYRIHSDVGNKTTGALINGRIAQLDSKLKNGDIVEILTSKTGSPKMHWLNFVVTKQAQSRIRQWFKKHNKDEYIALGKNMLDAELPKAILEEAAKSGELQKIAQSLNYQTIEDMLAALGNNETTVNKIANKLKKPAAVEETNIVTTKQPKSHKNDIIGLEGMLYNIAKCCTPLPGEPIVGVVTKGKGVSVHRIDCNCLDTVPEERLMQINWAEGIGNKTYVTSIRIDVEDKMGMLKEVLIKLADCNTNITYANVKANNPNKLGIIELGIEVDGIDRLRTVVSALQSLPDVHSVKRIPMNSNTKKYTQAQPKKKKTKTAKN
ncbi:MAG: bifunctional (p)ppGpp synthetase/guanosine-3',5'-bis(diphosphate) 3'-pyrophosphohydrolase [Candidatus Gastranaerophilales bacterium]|nr:bifunctional (p)ppGpp synthetase/guanosine-3',5'-bis(diphosphate) 3'-pyrophosphohydrolase [Candidatus Gastranaerophilales bacterium]